MRNRQLHDSLRAFALDAAHLLRSEQNAGAEVEFELEEGGRGGPTLYHYRPLSAKFIDERWASICALGTFEPAAYALEGGAAAYLRHNGMRDGGSGPALRALLERLYEEATDFSFPETRFETVYDEVEQTLYERRQLATVLVAVHGLELRGDRVELGDGLELARGNDTDAPDEAVWGDPGDPSRSTEQAAPNTLLRLTRDMDPEDPLPLDEARERFGDVLTGLRLFKPGGVALGAVAWRRTGDGRWAPFELEPTGTARGAPWILVDGEQGQLLEFLSAIGCNRRGTVDWALRRFEMGCGRRQETEALSDYLIALRALVDGGGESRQSSLALRVAVLCATDGERKRVQRRIELAQALERFVIGDGAGDDYLDSVGSDAPGTLVDEVERHLRALLRDVLCGYLRADLRSVADDLLLEQPEPFQIQASDARPEPKRRPVAVRPTRRFAPTTVAEPATSREVAVEPTTSVGEDLDAIERESDEPLVGQSQMDFDDDPSSYSAPV